MHYFQTIAILSLLAAPLVAKGAEPALKPQKAVLVLRNRQVIEGDVTPAGDYYLVSLGTTGQIRLAAKDVEMVCRDRHEAYQRKATSIADKSAEQHLELADWCIKQTLYTCAKTEITVARGIEPTHRRLQELDRRLEFATTEVKAAPKSVASTATVSAQQLERTMKEQPPGTVEHFTAVVQPILMDRCGAARCHGTGATTQFQLLQPTPGKIPSRRFTQRNLFAALAAVDKEMPEHSMLLIMSRKSHGPNEATPFKTDDDRQYREIAQWINSLRIVPRQSAPATVSTLQLGAARPQMGGTLTDDVGPVDRAEKEPTSPAASIEASPTGKDPFDPAIFNALFHKPE